MEAKLRRESGCGDATPMAQLRTKYDHVDVTASMGDNDNSMRWGVSRYSTPLTKASE